MHSEPKKLDPALPSVVEPETPSGKLGDNYMSIDDKILPPNEGRFDPGDSEAETERLHDSPTKKRLAEEIQYSNEDSKQSDGDSDSKQLDDSLKIPSEHASPQREPTPTNENDASEQPKRPIRETSGPEEFAAPEDLAARSSDDENSSHSDEEPEEIEEDSKDAAIDDHESDEERIKAINALAQIEIDFANIRNSLHDQQIEKYDLEITMCDQGIHPELEQYHQQIEEGRTSQLQRTRNLLTFEMNSILTHSHVTRCQAHQTFMKSKLALRSELTSIVTDRWRRLSRERARMTRGAPDYGYYASSQPYKVRKPTAQSLGIVKNESLLGLPVAPVMSQATDTECEEDFRRIGLL